MKANIGLSQKNLVAVKNELNSILADAVLLYTKTRKFHWNVAGNSFMELHKLFEHQYKQLEESIDEIAERIGKLGQITIGTMQEFSKLSSIKEHPGINSSSKDSLTELLTDHETLIIQLRKGIDDCAEKNKDAGTADFLTGLMEQHETAAWVLRRYLN